jgi:DNA primase
MNRRPDGMAQIPDDKVQEVRDRVDIVDLIGRYMELRRAGQNYKGLCPFHGEKTPSFNVNPTRKGFKCFGCGQGGDAIRFVMEIEGKSFPEAVRKLADLYGVTLPAESPQDAKRESEKDEAYALCTLATQTWQAILGDGPEGEAGRAYVASRGLNAESVEAFRLGYAPAPSEAGWDRLASTIAAKRLSLPMAERLGLIGRSEKSGQWYDRFRGRLVFPVVAPGGEVIAFSARVVPPHDVAVGDVAPPKYINSSESLLYTKGKSLYGLQQARAALSATRRAILVEGNLDVVRMHQWGQRETVAPLGTALTADQARLMARFCDQVVMAFDGDAAGRKAAWAALPLLLEADLDVRMVLLPEGEDPDSLGPERLKSMLARPEAALVEMMVRMAQTAGDAVDARARALDRILPLVARAPRESQRQLYADRAASLFDVPLSRVESTLRKLADAAAAAARSAGNGQSGPSHRDPSQPARDQGHRGPNARQPEENSRHFRSTSQGPVPLSAAVRPLQPLPAGQSQLAMLLVDAPHLAGVAERAGALDWIKDSRLAPIVHAVIDGARRGEELGMPELLALVEADAQALVHERVFAGEYRDLGATNPQAVLLDLVRRCEREALVDEKRRVDAEARRLAAEGFDREAAERQNYGLQLSRRIDELRRPVDPQPPRN